MCYVLKPLQNSQFLFWVSSGLVRWVLIGFDVFCAVGMMQAKPQIAVRFKPAPGAAAPLSNSPATGAAPHPSPLQQPLTGPTPAPVYQPMPAPAMVYHQSVQPFVQHQTLPPAQHYVQLPQSAPGAIVGAAPRPVISVAVGPTTSANGGSGGSGGGGSGGSAPAPSVNPQTAPVQLIGFKREHLYKHPQYPTKYGDISDDGVQFCVSCDLPIATFARLGCEHVCCVDCAEAIIKSPNVVSRHCPMYVCSFRGPFSPLADIWICLCCVEKNRCKVPLTAVVRIASAHIFLCRMPNCGKGFTSQNDVNTHYTSAHAVSAGSASAAMLVDSGTSSQRSSPPLPHAAHSPPRVYNR